MVIKLDGVDILIGQWAYDASYTMEHLAEYMNIISYGTYSYVTGCTFPVYSSISMTPSGRTATLKNVRVYKYVEA